MARIGSFVTRAVSQRGNWPPPLRRAYGNYEEFDVFAGADSAQKVRLDGYDEKGFSVNGVNIEGGIICLSRLTLKWTPRTFDEITPESLSIFKLLRPAPDILVLGCGKRMGRVSKELRDFLRSNGIKIEAIDTISLNNIVVRQEVECARHFNYLSGCCCGLDPLFGTTANATSTFNILNEEGRQVAAAMLPQGA